MIAIQLPSGPDTLLVAADFPQVAAPIIFNHWIEPTLLRRWWPQEAEVQPEPGGNYHLSWPQMGWHLRGHYTAFEPGQLLAFSWQWDHTPEDGEKIVQVRFEPMETDGTRLLLSHGPYTDTPQDQKLRIEDHLAGWIYFLPRLQKLLDVKRYRVVKNYGMSNTDPFEVRAGESFEVSGKVDAWDGNSDWIWIWCTDPRGKSGWVSKNMIDFHADGKTGSARSAYTARELTVSVGNELMGDQADSGWLWCTNRQGENGWVPLAHLSLLT
ncbi:SRPBCC family protein [Dictyobacter kobayashii]|uniref:Activator of Hsp90 ATPase homologue 1/2-like C-terminal domain-containing protein n=1 Tax=Dictyobacter kobayashii TaxID=2014872 RepID=A0A402AQG2_9CHLR|nr:SRPBCC domain-containing protein [Dictyobacter kobayashii]GCE21269.1 hypothetical protein KDK_50690 [Dictyobacter kobayashii]